MYPLRYLRSGLIYMAPGDDCDGVVDAMLETDYSEEFCLAESFDVDFFIDLMEAGFLVMSGDFWFGTELEGNVFILLPKLHLERSVLFFPDLHIKKSIRPFLSRYELRVNTDFELVLDRCVEIHGADWLTLPLVETIKSLRRREDERVKPFSFSVYRDGELKAGEIGVVVGRVYTSYSGYHEEKNAGTVQMILMAQWLEKSGFDFLDFGMPMEYKSRLGAMNISPSRFVDLFRAARW